MMKEANNLLYLYPENDWIWVILVCIGMVFAIYNAIGILGK